VNNRNPIQVATIVVVGGGYAGLFAAHRARRAAARARRADVRIIVVDVDDAWQERTRWHQVAAGETIRSRSRQRIFRGTGVETVTGTVVAIDLDSRAVHFTGDRQAPLPFDRLVYAVGSRSTACAVPGALDNAHTLDNAAASRRLALAVGQQPASRVLIVGGGLTGIQTAAQIAQRYPAARVTLLSSGAIGHELPDKARKTVCQALGQLGVQIVTQEHRVQAVQPGGVRWPGGQMDADLVVWTAGFAPSGLAAQAGLQVTQTGQVVVDDALRSVSHPFVFAAGDGAAVPRAASPYGAYAATATGATAGTNAGLDLAGQVIKPLNMGYSFLAASLGRRNAVVQLLNADGTPRPQMLTGRPASAIKEAIEHYVTFAIQAERTVPHVYQWRPAPKKPATAVPGREDHAISQRHRSDSAPGATPARPPERSALRSITRSE
jgi:NADH:ubiquinone reductase (H+-translocating)